MGRRRVDWGIVLLVVLIFSLFLVRLQLATGVEPLSYDSYLLVRQVDNIREVGAPLTDDSLSLTGNIRTGSPVFAYIMAGAVTISPAMYKILPNLFVILMLIPVYFLTLSFTKSRTASILASLLAGTAPSVFSAYLNTPSSAPLAVGLFLTLILLLQKPDKNLPWIVGCTLLLTFLSPIVFILAIALIVIITLLRLEGFGVDARITEIFIFATFLSVWYHVLIYKHALFNEGIRVLWQNLPAKYAALQFGTLTFLDLIYGLGVLTFLLGVFGAYHVLFETRIKASYSVVGSLIAVFLLSLFRLIELKLGLLILSLLLAIMAGHGLLTSARYLKRTKLPWMVYPIGILAFLLFVFTSIIPAISQAGDSLANAPSREDVEAFRALDSSLPPGVVLLTTVREGTAVQYYSGHTTVTDDDFLLLRNPDELVSDIDSVYQARFAVSLPGKADKLGFTHILFTNDAIEQYGRERILIEDHACIRDNRITANVLVYSVLCRGGS